MKFTKQEQSLIKLAAAHMAPQMRKKATLQDKLAEYGIGMNKKAADASSYMNALNPLTGLPNIAPAAKAGARLAFRVAPAVAGGATGDIAKAAPTKTPPAPTHAVQGSGTAGSFAKGNIANLIRQMSQKANARNAAAAQAGAAVGSALAGRQQGQSQAPASQQSQAPVASELPKHPMIGSPMPSTLGTPRFWGSGDDSAKYPYTYQRWLKTPPEEFAEGGDSSLENVRIFDNQLEKLQQSIDGVAPANEQALVDMARARQARTFADRITAPGTNQYNDAIQMLIQAGRNNQEAFENTGTTPTDSVQTGGSRTGIPKGYTGPNRLNEEQLRRLRNYYPAMGATGNARRFSNLS